MNRRRVSGLGPCSTVLGFGLEDSGFAFCDTASLSFYSQPVSTLTDRCQLQSCRARLSAAFPWCGPEVCGSRQARKFRIRRFWGLGRIGSASCLIRARVHDSTCTRRARRICKPKNSSDQQKGMSLQGRHPTYREARTVRRSGCARKSKPRSNPKP